MTLRELLKELGFQQDGNSIIINSDNPILDLYPKRLTDDGMGYGIGEEYMTEVSTDNKEYLFIFTNKYNEEDVKIVEEEYRLIEEKLNNKKINN